MNDPSIEQYEYSDNDEDSIPISVLKNQIWDLQEKLIMANSQNYNLEKENQKLENIIQELMEKMREPLLNTHNNAIEPQKNESSLPKHTIKTMANIQLANDDDEDDIDDIDDQYEKVKYDNCRSILPLSDSAYGSMNSMSLSSLSKESDDTILREKKINHMENVFETYSLCSTDSLSINGNKKGILGQIDTNDSIFRQPRGIGSLYGCLKQEAVGLQGSGDT